MTIVMNMSGYEIEHEEVSLDEYGDEMMRAELALQLVMVGDRHAVGMDKHTTLPRELADVDVEVFLQKMDKYHCQ